MSTEAIDRSRNAANLNDRDERAQRAVKTFRSMQHGLTAYARAITGNKDTRVEIASGPPRTDGTLIYYRPPIALGDKTPHLNRECDNRDENGLRVCPACRIREEVLVNIYHEIAHIAFGTFEQTTDADRRAALDSAITEWGGKYEEKIRKAFAEASFDLRRSFQGLSNLVSPYLPFLVNALEDARVDSAMFEKRKGTRKMLQADVYALLRDPDRNWSEAPLNSQIAVACYFYAAGYSGWAEHLHPKIAEDITDKALLDVLDKVKYARSARDTYTLAFPVLARLRELGYLKDERDEDDEPQPEPTPEPEPEDGPHDPADGDEDDAEEGGDDSPGDDNSDGHDGETDADDNEQENGDQSDDGAEGSDSSESDGSDPATDGSDDGTAEPGDGEADQGESGDEASDPTDSGDREDGPDAGEAPAEAEDQDDSGSTGAAEPEGGEDEPEGDASESGGEADGAEAGAPEPDGQDDGADDGDQGADDADGTDGGELSADQDGVSEEAGDGPDDGGDVRADEGEPSDGVGEPDAGEDAGLDDGEADAPEQGDPAGSPEADPSDVGEGVADGADTDAGDGPEGDGPELDEHEGDRQEGDGPQASAAGVDHSDEGDAGDGDEDRDGEPSEGPGDDGDQAVEPEPIDSGADQGEGGIKVEAQPLPEYGTPDDVAATADLLHDEAQERHEAEQGDYGDQKAIDTAVLQGQYFETPSVGVSSVEEYRYSTDAPAWIPIHNRQRAIEWGIECDVDVPESVLGPILLKARRIFNDNKTSTMQNNMRSGNINSKVLGKRAWSGDDRLFHKKRIPGRKDYAVLIGVDISTSNRGTNIALVKRAVTAQADLLARLGVPFAIVAHSAGGNFADAQFTMALFHVKDWNEPWDNAVRERVATIRPVGGNLDGHALEFMRNHISKQDATDKIILYYTDGKMPAANAEEELEVLQRQLKLCRRQQIELLGVGICTDSPVRHGLDTVQVDTDDDLKTVVDHLGKRLLRRGR